MTSGEHLGTPVRFGVFEVDLQTGELRKHGLKIKLRDQPFQILALLLERPGQVVNREELKAKLWAVDTFVDFDRGLNKAINRLREALGDSADSPRFIETLPKRGYRFVAPVEDSPVSAPRPAGAITAAPELAPAPGSVVGDPVGRREAPLRDVPTEPKSQPSAPIAKRPSPTIRGLLAVAAVIAAGAAATFFVVRQSPLLTARDTLVLADFDNRTGDPAFNYTLKQALAMDLEQSPYLKIVSERSVVDTLRLMGRAPDRRLTPDVARELCQRAGSKVVLSGSIANLGSQYVIGINAVNCLTAETVEQEQIRVNRKEEILGELDKATADLRRKLGESLSSIQKFYRPIQQDVTTASFEAFQEYTNGQIMVIQKGRPAGIPFFRRAVELDPGFALAHAALGLLYRSVGETILSAEHSRRAYEFRDRVSSQEKLWIALQYHISATGRLEKAIEDGQIWSQNYPRDWIPHERLATVYLQQGQCTNALAEYRQALSLEGHNPIVEGGLVSAFICLDRFGDAKAVFREARPYFREGVYLLNFFDGNTGKMHEEVALAMHRPGDEDLALAMQADSEAYFGHLEKARTFSRQAIESALRNDFKERAALWDANAALREAEFGNAEAARRQANAALTGAAGQNVRARVGLALARAGDATQALRLADQLNTDFSSATVIQNYWLPAIRAQLELHSGNPKEAIELLGAAESYELTAGTAMIPTWVRAESYLAGRQGPAAAAEFQKILQHRGIAGNNPVGALAHLGLARAYVLAGDTAKARARYLDFFALWKGADPNIPVLQEANAEYANFKRDLSSGKR